MKIITIILIFMLNFSYFFSISPQDVPTSEQPENKINESIIDHIEEKPRVDEDDLFNYEEEIFSRKLFQRRLPVLSKKEKIIWSFRMAQASPFL